MTVALVGAVVPVAGHPPADPDHGVNASTYYTLWSGDVDDVNATPGANGLPDDATVMRSLAAVTDIPLARPPAAVEQWNRGDLQEFPRTDENRSLHPPTATLVDGVFVKDAYIETFAVQPSTRVRRTPGETTLVVSPTGTVLATVDYRVEMRPAVSRRDERIEWSILSHEISEVRLLVDGEEVSTQAGAHTAILPYSITDGAGRSHTLTAVAVVSTRLERRHAICASMNSTGNCTAWNTTVSTQTETLTVRDSVDVEVTGGAVRAVRARYPDGSTGLVLSSQDSWTQVSGRDWDVRNVWQFYAARDTSWDTLITSTEEGNQTAHSPLHPLQVSAYPATVAPPVPPSENVSLLAVDGEPVQPPALPAHVELRVAEGPYTDASTVVLRTDEETASDSLQVTGLVRGVRRTVDVDALSVVDVHESSLSLAVVNTTAETVTLSVELRDAETGEPIATTDRAGSIVVGDISVNTSDAGTATVTLPRSVGVVTARYEPADWWTSQATRAYTGDSDVLSVPGTPMALQSTVYELGVPLLLFLFAVFIIDRFTGWGLWPPWRFV